MFKLPKKDSKKSRHRWHVIYDLAVWYEIVCAVDIPQNEEVDKMLKELGLDKIVFDFQAGTPEIYNKMMGTKNYYTYLKSNSKSNK